MPHDKTLEVAPYPLAMVICDAVWRSPATGKWTLLGCFSSIASANFPCKHHLLSIFVSLSDGRGKTPVRLCLIDPADEDKPLAELALEVEFTDPRMVADLQFQFSDLSFPQPGEYRFQLSAHDKTAAGTPRSGTASRRRSGEGT